MKGTDETPQYIFNRSRDESEVISINDYFIQKSFQNAFRIFLELFHLKNMFMINYNLAIVTKVSTNDLFNIFFVIFLSDCQLKSRRCWKK